MAGVRVLKALNYCVHETIRIIVSCRKDTIWRGTGLRARQTSNMRQNVEPACDIMIMVTRRQSH